MSAPTAPCDAHRYCGHSYADHDEDGCRLCACDEYEEPMLANIERENNDMITDPPAPPEGFILIECTAEPRHWPVYTVDLWGYGAPCMYCAYDSAHAAHAGCEHSHHRAWRAWRITHWLAGWAYQFRWIRGLSFHYDAHCRGCITIYPRRRRP